MIPQRDDTGFVLEAVRFAAEKHKNQRRKGAESPPYINHPVEVAEHLWRVGKVRKTTVITAALLHDTLEDTSTTPEEIRERFGEEVLGLVREVTDDKRLPKQERKRLQIDHAPGLSPGAKEIKLADKYCNVRDIAENPPVDWSPERKREYLHWAQRVANGLRGANPALEKALDELLVNAGKQVEKTGECERAGTGS